MQVGRALALMTVFASFFNNASAQQTTNPTEPEYIQQYFTKGSDGLLTPLERQTMQHQIKNHNYVFAVKVQSVEVIQGSKSAVRVSPDTHFIVRMDTGDRDPTTLIHLVHVTEGKNERDIIKGGQSGYIFTGG